LPFFKVDKKRIEQYTYHVKKNMYLITLYEGF